MLSIIRIEGDSLSPFLNHGDYILVVRLPWLLRRVKPGEVVVFRQPGYGVLVKRVQSVSTDGEALFVIGDHPDSADSRSFGPVPRASLTGKMLAAFRKQANNR